MTEIESMDKGNDFNEKLNYYRKFFLDSNGSNALEFINGINTLISELIFFHTGKRIMIDFKGEIYEDYSHLNNDSKITKGDESSKKIIDIFNIYDPDDYNYNLAISECINDIFNIAGSEVIFNNKFMGQIHPCHNIPSYYAGIVAKFINGNTIAYEVSPCITYKEKEIIALICEAFGYNPDLSMFYEFKSNDGKLEKIINDNTNQGSISSGSISLGGTTANLAALLVARNKAFPDDKFWSIKGVRESGMLENKGVVFGSNYSHYSLEKLCDFSGIGSSNFKKIKTKNYKIDVEDLEKRMWESESKKLRVIGVFATAGTTETGTIDDLKSIGNLIDKFEEKFNYRPHFHVDAAYGGGFVFHNKYNPKEEQGLFKGIEKADSITIDPHKMLYTHYNAGMILFKNKIDHALLKQDASYIFKNNDKIDLGQFRIEGSLALEGVLQTYASLKTIKPEGYGVILENTLLLTNYLNKIVREDKNFEVLNEPELNTLCFRYVNKDVEKNDPELINIINKRAHDKMYNNGLAYISNDKLIIRDGEFGEEKADVFRAVIMHPYTTKKDVEFAFNEVKKAVAQVLIEYKDNFENLYKNI